MVRIVTPIVIIASGVLLAVSVAAAGWWALAAMLGMVGAWFGVNFDPDES